MPDVYQGDEYEQYMNDPDRMTQREVMDLLYEAPKPFIQQREFDPETLEYTPFQINWDVPFGAAGDWLKDTINTGVGAYNAWWEKSWLTPPEGDTFMDYVLSGDMKEEVSEWGEQINWDTQQAQQQRIRDKFPHIPEDTLEQMFDEYNVGWTAPFKEADQYYKDLGLDPITGQSPSDEIAAGRTEANKYLKDYTYYLEDPPYLPTADFFPDIAIEGAGDMSLQEGIAAGFNALYQEYGGTYSFENYENADVLYLEFFRKNEMWDELERAGGMDYALELGANWMSEVSGQEVGVNDAGQIVAPEGFDLSEYLDEDDLDLMEGLGWIEKPPQVDSPFGGGGYYPQGRYGYPQYQTQQQVGRKPVMGRRRSGVRLTSWRI